MHLCGGSSKELVFPLALSMFSFIFIHEIQNLSVKEQHITGLLLLLICLQRITKGMDVTS